MERVGDTSDGTEERTCRTNGLTSFYCYILSGRSVRDPAYKTATTASHRTYRVCAIHARNYIVLGLEQVNVARVSPYGVIKHLV
eukprot:124861-Prorocentrum_minimum.AAC.2